MKKLACIGLCVFALAACEKNKPETAVLESSVTENHKQDIQLGNKFVVVNDMTNKNLKILSHETNLTGDGKYYYQIEIQNLSGQPFNIKTEQIVLVDSAGVESRVKLIDRELNEPFEVNESKTGIVAFDDIGPSKPKYLKFVDAS